MISLRITARVPMGYSARMPIHLDALLMAAGARRRGLISTQVESELEEVPIPVARSECGRYYLASAAIAAVAARERVHYHRQFPTTHALVLAGPKLKSVNDKAGAQKSYRMAYTREHPEFGELVWFAVGDRDAITDLLDDVTHLGRRRNAGEGMLSLRGDAWTVEECEPWEGFPVLDAEGRGLRNLPLDTPGLVPGVIRYGRVDPPYWLPSRESISAPSVLR